MLRLDRLSKDFREAGALNQQINLYGFIDEHTFLTKTGDVGVLLEVQGLDYESLDSGSVDTYTKRLESAMRLKRSLISQMKMSDGPEHPSEMLIDDSKEAQVRDLGDALEETGTQRELFRPVRARRRRAGREGASSVHSQEWLCHSARSVDAQNAPRRRVSRVCGNGLPARRLLGPTEQTTDNPSGSVVRAAGGAASARLPFSERASR